MDIVIRIVDTAFWVYNILLIVRILLSWIPHNPYQPVIRFIYEITEPFLGLFRRFIPPMGPLDLSPIVAFFVLQLIWQALIKILLSLSLRFHL